MVDTMGSGGEKVGATTGPNFINQKRLDMIAARLGDEAVFEGCGVIEETTFPESWPQDSPVILG
jgi:hypothetical protein